MKINILYISYDGMTDHLGQSQVLPYLINLTKYGYRFTILSCEKLEKYNKISPIIKESCKRNKINWSPIFYTKNPPVFSTLNDIRKLNKRALELHETITFHATHCRSYIPALVGLKLKKELEIPFIFDMRGFYPEEKTEVNTWPLSNPLYKFVYNYFKRKEVEFFALADGVISLTEAGKIEIESWGIRNPSKKEIKVIPCSVDFEHFKPISTEQKKETKTNLNLPLNTKIVVFIGSIGSWYLLDETLDFFKTYQSIYENSKLFFISTDSEDHIKKRALEKGLTEQDIFVKPAIRSEVPSFLSVADVGLFFIKPYYSKKGSSPTKLGEYLALNIPVFTNTGIGDVDEIIANSGGGVIVRNFSRKDYLNAIEEMDQLEKRSDKSIRELSRNYYDLNTAVQAYLDIYKDVIN